MFWVIIPLLLLFWYKLVDWFIRSIKVSDYSRKYVFITGCDSGFGEALALRLDGLGFHVIAGCLSDFGRIAITAKASSRLVSLVIDVGDTASIQNAVKVIKRTLPPNRGLWAVVNNAGMTGPLSCSEMCPEADFARVMAVNLFGSVNICRALLPLIRKVKGRVINTTSTCGFFASVGSAYTTSKFGLEGFSDSLRREVQDLGVKVSIVEPGFFKTNIVNFNRIERGLIQAVDQAHMEVKTAYGPNYVKEGLETVNVTAPDDINPVIDAYVHALVSKNPRTRYVIGRDAKILMVLGYLVPTWIADGLMWLGRKSIRRRVAKKFGKK